MAEYCNKKDMLDEIAKYRKAYLEAKNNNTELPSVSNELAKMFIDITTGIARRPNFSGYSYIDEMKSRALFACLNKAHCFDPEKSDNPFGYYSRVIWREFLNVLKEEEKESYIKAKAFYNSEFASYDISEIDSDVDVSSEGSSVPFFDVEGYEEKNGIKNSLTIKVDKKKEKKGPLSDLFEDDEDFDIEEDIE